VTRGMAWPEGQAETTRTMGRVMVAEIAPFAEVPNLRV
jgi:hypothetical protein